MEIIHILTHWVIIHIQLNWAWFFECSQYYINEQDIIKKILKYTLISKI